MECEDFHSPECQAFGTASLATTLRFKPSARTSSATFLAPKRKYQSFSHFLTSSKSYKMPKSGWERREEKSLQSAFVKRRVKGTWNCGLVICNSWISFMFRKRLLCLLGEPRQRFMIEFWNMGALLDEGIDAVQNVGLLQLQPQFYRCRHFSHKGYKIVRLSRLSSI